MRRFVVKSTSLAALAVPLPTMSTRDIYTTWGSIPLESWATKDSWLKLITNKSRYRSFEFWHVPEVSVPEEIQLSSVEKYLLSCIEDDTQRLLNLSWTYDFDSFWSDRVQSHEHLYAIIYKTNFPLYKFFFGDCSKNETGRIYIEKKLNYLKSVYYWAAMTERRYTAIVKARYHVQREVWNAFERERYLAGCVEIVESFKEKIPEEFADKAISELENDLMNMRHWIWDCPNAKRTFSKLA